MTSASASDSGRLHVAPDVVGAADAGGAAKSMPITRATTATTRLLRMDPPVQLRTEPRQRSVGSRVVPDGTLSGTVRQERRFPSQPSLAGVNAEAGASRPRG